MSTQMDYRSFLESKTLTVREGGLEVSAASINQNLKRHARDIARWAIRGGRRAIFANFGLHKTSIQLQIAQSILDNQSGNALIVCPLGVKQEFVREAVARKFSFVPQYIRTNDEYEQHASGGQRVFLTNYERVRDGGIDPNRFAIASLDEAAVLRSFGSVTYQRFLTLFDEVPFKYVCTATPSPNRFKELIHYAAFLGIMDSGQALTRWFKRDSSSAGNLTLYPHKEQEFWLWVSTWAIFITKPSDLGYDDTGYDLPKLNIHHHRLPVTAEAVTDSWGQRKLQPGAATDLKTYARERRSTIADRVAETKKIMDAGQADQHWVIWHDLEDERHAIKKAIRDAVSVYGTQDLEEREQAIADFSDGKNGILSTKPSVAGSGCNLQRHCHSAIYFGIGFKFHDFIQSVMRLYRFLQTQEVDIHLIYTESEEPILTALMDKWKQHNYLVGKMTEIVKQYGLSNTKLDGEMRRSIGVSRQEAKGAWFTAVNNDNVLEMETLPDNSVDLVVSSWPFSNHYEYTASYNDFGHNTDDDRFFEQMDYLTPHMLRTLKPGRMYCVHAKDRLLYGSVTGLGMYSVNPFSDKCIAHLRKHGLIYCGRITIVTDVVRENNQTYRLGWTEKCKDGTKMGVGSPEYILLFRKLPSDNSKSYADQPVVKAKDAYTRSRWQFDASPFWRSKGDRFISPEEIAAMPQDELRKLWHRWNEANVYEFEEHVKIAESLEKAGRLPSSFMLLDPKSHSRWVWDDVVRMRTLNTVQSRKALQSHICPLQFDVVERLIETYSNEGDLVLDPFAGLMTVPYVAVGMGRRGYGIELSADYWEDGVAHCRLAEDKTRSRTLFDLMDAEGVEEGAAA